MPASTTRMSQFIAEEVKKVKGIAIPARATMAERVFVRNVNAKNCIRIPTMNSASLKSGLMKESFQTMKKSSGL